MTTGSDKSQSAIIQHRLPEFVQTNHPTLVAFVQAYYEWLESQKESGYMRTPSALDGFSDIDTTLDSFVADFKKEFLLGFPEQFAVDGEGNTVDVRKLIKNIKEFYRNKGTEKTYEFLFRVLYDTAVEFYYPAKDILRLSDGKWIQKYSIRCSNTLGNRIFDARGKTVVQKNLTTGNVVASGRVVDVMLFQVGSREVSELFLTNINGTFVANTKSGNENYGGIEFTDNDSVTRTEPRLYPVIRSITITSQGSGYRKGESILFTPSGDSGVGAAATITEVDSMGGIIKTRIDNFGIGYENTPSYMIETAFGESGALSVTTGSTCVYPGYYSGSDGKLSSSKVMQDNHYYQNFSYVLLSEVVIDRYKEILRRIIHPAGMGMFGKVLITRCAAETPETDSLVGKVEVPVLGNYAPYTIYTKADLSELFYDDRPMPYYPSLHEDVIVAATGNPAAITGHHAIAFDPRNLSNLKVWLDGTYLTAAGATVSAWGDRSGNGFTATAVATNMLPSISEMNGLYLTGSIGTAGSIMTTPSLGTLNERTMFVAFTPFPVSDSVTRQRNAMVAGLQRSGGEGVTQSATGQLYQNHTICIDYQRNNIDGLSDTQPRIAAYYGFGNFGPGYALYTADNTQTIFSHPPSSSPQANRQTLISNSSSVVYKELLDLESTTAANVNTVVACSTIGEIYPSNSIQVYSDPTEVISLDKKSNDDLSPLARYYRYHKMAEYTIPEEGDGSYSFSMDQESDYGAFEAWRAILTKNDGVVIPTTTTLSNVPNVIAEWNSYAMSTGSPEATPYYKNHTVTAKGLKAGDVVRVWMSYSGYPGQAPYNSSLDTSKSMKLKNFVVSRIYSQAESILTIDGDKIGYALGNLNGLTAQQRLVMGLGQNYFNGVIHEVLVYDRALNSRERETVEAYLHYKWKERIIAATGHSWKLPLAPNSVLNGSFEFPLVPQGSFTTFNAGSTGIPGMTVLNSAVSIVNTGLTAFGFRFQSNSDNQWLDLSGEGGMTTSKGISQILQTEPGEEYNLSFYVGSAYGYTAAAWTNMSPATVDVSIDGGSRISFTNTDLATNQMNWKLFSTVFVASGATTSIEFFYGNTGPSGPFNFACGLDDVSVAKTTNKYGIHPALPENGGITANATTGSSLLGYPFFEVRQHPNVSLSQQDTYAARILSSQAYDFLGMGGTGSTGYWPEWAEGSTANRQNWAIGLSAEGSRHAILQYNTSSEFRKITADAFFDMKAGRQFDCKDEYVTEPNYPKVSLSYSDEFSNSSFEDPIYSNGGIIFHFTTENAQNMEYWTTDLLEFVVSDGRGEYFYRPDNITSKVISGFVSDGTDAKQYTVTVRLLDFYGKPIPDSENSVTFWFKYLSTAGTYDSLS